MTRSIDEINSNNFYSHFNSLIDTNETPDEILKNPDTIDKIQAFLDSHRKELIGDVNNGNSNHQSSLRSLANRISGVYTSDSNSKILKIITQLRETADFHESLNQWRTEDGLSYKEDRHEACKRIKDAWINQSAELELDDLCLTKLPSCIGQLTHLQQLNLKGNKLKDLPDSIRQLTQLKELNLNDNKFKNFPDPIGQLTQLQYLNLGANSLSSVPDSIGQLTLLEKLYLNANCLSDLPDSIWQLTQLNSLDLSVNEFRVLPDSIGQLNQLKILHLGGNELKDLPNSIGQLNQLKILHLGGNELKDLPNSIGQLNQLKTLDLSENKLENLPNSIGQLTLLKTLNLNENKLTNIPVAIGNLINIKTIAIHNNPQLRELPLSLGQISGITYLDYGNTGIPQEQINAILDACTALRAQQSNLMPHLELWKNAAKKDVDLSKIFNRLTDSQQVILNEWLIRLEKTSDFQYCQQELATIVCDMLSTFSTDDEFKRDFFMQAEVNNEACQDRAAMSLNEIYTSWKIRTLPKDASVAEKLEILTRAAKTSALRQAVGMTIDEHQKKTGVGEREAVETYLYYETHLREKLGLLSAIQTMAYAQIGQRDWINEDTLKNAVELTYRDELVDYPAFKTVAEQDSSFQAAWEPLFSVFAEKMSNLDEQKDELTEGEYLQQVNSLRDEQDRQWKTTALQWFDQMSSHRTS